MEAVYENPSLSTLKDYLLSFQYGRARRALELGCAWSPELSELFPPKDVLWLLEHRHPVTPHACFRCYLEYPNSKLFACDVDAMNKRDAAAISTGEKKKKRVTIDKSLLLEKISSIEAHLRKKPTLETTVVDALVQFDSVSYDDRPEVVRRLVRDLPPHLRQHVANLALYLTVADTQFADEENAPWKPEDFIVDDDDDNEISV